MQRMKKNSVKFRIQIGATRTGSGLSYLNFGTICLASTASARVKGNPKMNWLWIGLLALGFVHSSAVLAQGPPEFTVFTFGDTSCAAWTKSRTDDAMRAQFQAWFRGFVSGYNFGNSANQVLSGAMPNPADVALHVDKYCRENPKLAFIGIVIPLIQEIREYRVPAPMQKP